MQDQTFVVITLGVLAFGLFSARLTRSPITAPMVFVAFGLAVGPRMLGLAELHLDDPAVQILAELTLVLVLFTDAARIDFAVLRREYTLPLRLLLIGLPLTVLAGAVVGGLLLPSLGFWEVALLAAVLAPTDAALGLSVVNNTRIPVRMRQTLNVESGLNDGIVLPLVLLFAACAGGGSGAYGPAFIGKQLVLGPITGVFVGLVGGRIIVWAERTNSMNHSFRQLSGLAQALLAYAFAERIGGNGFIASFCAGLTMGNTAHSPCECLFDFAETEGQLLSLLTFMLFGTLMVAPAAHHWDWRVLVYTALSLTAIRMAPVAVSLVRARLRWPSVAFLGWFGPRGLASILFACIVVRQPGIPGRMVIFDTVVTTVLFSVLLHGLTAYPAALWYGRYADGFKHLPDAEEHAHMPELPVRIPVRK
ncbi:MAG: cation:proton antiporter [Candidatus Hydrogenedentes bacterium]|nr:cation:proton antiporter [Candidatus Hydrogenedentota bacterium]